MSTPSPLLPATAHDAKVLFGLISEHIAESVGWLDDALHPLAMECVLHGVRAAHGITPPLPRVVVLHGSDPLTLLHAARAAAASTFFPTAEVSLHAMSETNWHGQSLSDIVAQLSGHAWSDRAIFVFVGLDSLRVRRGTYTGTYGTTREYREGKSEDISGLLAGHVIPTGSSRWTANRALIIVTAPLQYVPDAAGLRDWGLTEFLSELLVRAAWLRIESAAAPLTHSVVRQQLRELETVATLLGLELRVATETINWVLKEAGRRGDTGVLAAHWIKESARRALLNTLQGTAEGNVVVLGPDDVEIPLPCRGQWRD